MSVKPSASTEPSFGVPEVAVRVVSPAEVLTVLYPPGLSVWVLDWAQPAMSAAASPRGRMAFMVRGR